jgi:hypothetical protein
MKTIFPYKAGDACHILPPVLNFHRSVPFVACRAYRYESSHPTKTVVELAAGVEYTAADVMNVHMTVGDVFPRVSKTADTFPPLCLIKEVFKLGIK